MPPATMNVQTNVQTIQKMPRPSSLASGFSVSAIVESVISMFSRNNREIFIVRNVVWKECAVSATQNGRRSREQVQIERQAEMTTYYNNTLIDCDSPSVQTLNKD